MLASNFIYPIRYYRPFTVKKVVLGANYFLKLRIIYSLCDNSAQSRIAAILLNKIAVNNNAYSVLCSKAVLIASGIELPCPLPVKR